MAWAPNPPNFYKQFTTENVTRLEQVRAESTNTSSQSLLNLPPELRYLVPPAPPSDNGDYRLFGTPRTTRDYLRPLPEQEIEQLYPSSANDADTNDDPSSDWTLDRQVYLKSLTRSIMLSFLELVGMLAENPTEAHTKQEQIKTMYLNALHLVNEYRPHQARESLILRMEDEIEKGRKEVEEVRVLRERVEALLGAQDGGVDALAGGVGLNGHTEGANGVNGTEAAKADEKGAREAQVQRAIWDVLNAEFPRSRQATAS
jgi:mediator of RNA polymerase II transcription subunit 7